MVSYSETVEEDVEIIVGYKDTSLENIRFPRMPRKEVTNTSSGIVKIVFENDINDVDIIIYKDGKDVKREIYSEIVLGTELIYNLNDWGEGIYIVKIVTNEYSISRIIEF